MRNKYYTLEYKLGSDAAAQMARAIMFKYGGETGDVVFLGSYRGVEQHHIKSRFIFGLNVVLAKLDIDERYGY